MKKTWKEMFDGDMTIYTVHLDKDDIMDRCKWRILMSSILEVAVMTGGGFF